MTAQSGVARVSNVQQFRDCASYQQRKNERPSLFDRDDLLNPRNHFVVLQRIETHAITQIVSREFSNIRHLAARSEWPYSDISMVKDHSPERRTAARYRLQLPVIFHWVDGREHTEGGFTSDIALDGALILSSRCPPVGAEVRIEVLIPSPDQSAEEIRIECIGKVTRVWEQPGSAYFGVHGMFNDDQLTRHVIN